MPARWRWISRRSWRTSLSSMSNLASSWSRRSTAGWKARPRAEGPGHCGPKRRSGMPGRKSPGWSATGPDGGLGGPGDGSGGPCAEAVATARATTSVEQAREIGRMIRRAIVLVIVVLLLSETETRDRGVGPGRSPEPGQRVPVPSPFRRNGLQPTACFRENWQARAARLTTLMKPTGGVEVSRFAVSDCEPHECSRFT
jgi:hypothetical protein